MSDMSEKSSTPAVYVVEGARSTASPTERRCTNRKCVVGAATTLMVVALVIVGVLVAIKLNNDADLERLKIHRKLKSGETLVDEEFYQQRDSDNWLLKYHVTDPDSDTWALNEFDKGVQILKVQLKFGGYACFIIRQPVMNGTAAVNNVRRSAADNTDSSEVINMRSNVTNVRFKVAIISGDISALIGSAGQSFCADLQIYAAIPDTSPRDTDSVNGGRQKRQFFYYYCYISILVCGEERFQDSPYFYYRCPDACSQIFY